MTNIKRKEKDISKLLISNFDVVLKDENKMNELYVILRGPKESPYEEVSKKFKFSSLIIFFISNI